MVVLRLAYVWVAPCVMWPLISKVGRMRAANMLCEGCGCTLVFPSSLRLLNMEVVGLDCGGGMSTGIAVQGPPLAVALELQLMFAVPRLCHCAALHWDPVEESIPRRWWSMWFLQGSWAYSHLSTGPGTETVAVLCDNNRLVSHLYDVTEPRESVQLYSIFNDRVPLDMCGDPDAV